MTARKSRWLKLVAAAIPLTAVALALTLVLVGRSGSTKPVSADFPHAGLNLTISTGTCDTTGGVNTCMIPNVGDDFTVNLNLATLPGDLTYAGYDWNMTYTGVTLVEASLGQQGAGAWPSCTFPAHEFGTAGYAAIGCAGGISAAPSTYTGPLAHVDFSCDGSGDLTLLDDNNHGSNSASDLIDGTLFNHGESNGQDVLHIQCGPQTPTPAATPTPCDGPCPTATPTNTPPPATPTPALQLGDVNGDGMVDSVDALWVLWYDAGVVSVLAHPENADLNHDGMINSIDASLILQIVAGLYHP